MTCRVGPRGKHHELRSYKQPFWLLLPKVLLMVGAGHGRLLSAHQETKGVINCMIVSIMLHSEWLNEFLGPLAVGPGPIPSKWSDFLEPTPMKRNLAQPRWGGGLCPASVWWCDKIPWLSMGGFTLSEEQMGQWGERKVGEQEGREEGHLFGKNLVLST